MLYKGQNRPLNVSFPTHDIQHPLFFQNSRLSQSAQSPCRLSFGGVVYHARIHHAEVGHQNKPLARRAPGHAHPVYHIVVTTGGNGHFRLDDALTAVARKTLVTTGPRQSHCFQRVEGETTCYAEVTFDFVDQQGRTLEAPFQEMLSAWAGQESNCHSHQRISEPATAKLERLIENLIRVGSSPASDLTFLRLSTTLVQILEHCHTATLEPGVPSMPWEKARQILLEGFARTFSVAELAERVGVHPDYLTRRFRKAYGIAPLGFQNRLRIEAAKTWLISTEYTLKEIAERIGYADPGYFARVFRRKMKTSPGQFRRTQRVSGE